MTEKIDPSIRPMPSSHFIKVTCPECKNAQTIFDKASTTIKCNQCGALISEPTGGKAKIYGEIIEVLD